MRTSLLALLVALGALATSGCADEGSPPVAVEPEAGLPLPLASEIDLAAHSVTVALPPGPSSSVVFVDIPAAAWQQGSFVSAGDAAQGVDAGWNLQMEYSFQDLDSNGEERPTPGALLILRLEGRRLAPLVASLGASFTDDTARLVATQACAPSDGRYAVVPLLGGDAQGATFTFGLAGNLAADGVTVGVDVAAGAPAIASYHETINVARGDLWAVTDSRTGVSDPAYGFGARTGDLALGYDGPSGSPGFYAFWYSHAVVGAATGEWTFTVGTDAAPDETTVVPINGAYVAGADIHGAGTYKDQARLGTTLSLTEDNVGGTDLMAYLVPIDVATLGLELPAIAAVRYPLSDDLGQVAAAQGC